MDERAYGLLTQRFVLFSCEGTAEGVVIQSLYDNDLLLVSREHVVKDAVMTNRPYTRKRKAGDIADIYFSMSYEDETARGLTVARIVDSRAPKFEFPKRRQNGTEVLSFFTRPEIEMLVIHGEGAYDQWARASRKDRQLRPNEFCVRELGFTHVKEAEFLRGYWGDADKLVKAIRGHAQKADRGRGELLLADLLRRT